MKQARTPPARRPQHPHLRSNYIKLVSVGVGWTRSNLSFDRSHVGACERRPVRVAERHASKNAEHKAHDNTPWRTRHKLKATTPHNTTTELHSTHPSFIVTLNPTTTVLTGGWQALTWPDGYQPYCKLTEHNMNDNTRCQTLVHSTNKTRATLKRSARLHVENDLAPRKCRTDAHSRSRSSSNSKNGGCPNRKSLTTPRSTARTTTTYYCTYRNRRPTPAPVTPLDATGKQTYEQFATVCYCCCVRSRHL